MTKLTVQQFGGVRAGTIAQRPDGSLAIQGETPELEKALRALVDKITSGPLRYRTGREEKTPEGVKYVTVVKVCERGDPDYLSALADAFTRHKLLGKRIRGVVK